MGELAASGRRLKLFYTIATFNTPTGTCLVLERRRRLLELAERWDFLILEDNVYRDLRYSGTPVPTLFALDPSDRVLSVESFSKVVAPGLRIGWVAAHPQLIAAMAAVRDDLGASQWMSHLMAAYLEEGLLDPHIQTVVSLLPGRARCRSDGTRKVLRGLGAISDSGGRHLPVAEAR